MNRKKLALFGVIIALVAAYYFFGLGQYFSLDFFKSQQAAIESYRAQQPLLAATIFFVVYVAVTALSFPGAALLTLVGGAVFGLHWGTVLLRFALT